MPTATLTTATLTTSTMKTATLKTATLILEKPVNSVQPKFTALTFGVCCAFSALALFWSLELNIKVIRFFKRRSGLYFWSLIATATGVGIHVFGNLLRWFSNAPWEVGVFFALLGVQTYTIGQCFILYSRLHLVMRNRNILRVLFVLIIVASVCWGLLLWSIRWPVHIPSLTKRFTPIFARVEHGQAITFVILEFGLSALYIWATVDRIRPNVALKHRRVAWELILVNVALVALDVVWIVLMFLGYATVKVPMQALCYGLKVKIEFAILNQLKALTNLGSSSNPNSARRYRRQVPNYGGGSSGAPTNTAISKRQSQIAPMDGVPKAFDGQGSRGRYDAEHTFQVTEVGSDAANTPFDESFPETDGQNARGGALRTWWHKIPTGETSPAVEEDEEKNLAHDSF